MIKNIVDWMKFVLLNPIDKGSYNDVLEKTFKKEVKRCMVSEEDASDVQED